MSLRLAIPIAVALTATPALAQDDESRSLMERGAELFMEGLRQEMAPTLDDLRTMADQFGPAMSSFLAEMGPALGDILEEVKDWSTYHPPEILPNGDIIMRRKTDIPPDPAPETTPEDDSTPSGPTDI
ncbi:MAG: hypothetical protein ACI8R4_001718 [Paracoccaceae bacterium]|jgi:hypothetical protein